jgi:hypothetical protein
VRKIHIREIKLLVLAPVVIYAPHRLVLWDTKSIFGLPMPSGVDVSAERPRSARTVGIDIETREIVVGAPPDVHLRVLILVWWSKSEVQVDAK